MRSIFGQAGPAPQKSPPESTLPPAKAAGQAQLLVLAERQLILSGRIASFEVARRDRIATLADVEFRVFSQWGEDGILEWLCCRLPDIPPRFVEFGVETYREANTRFLLENRGWSGLVLDADEAAIAAILARPTPWRRDLCAVAAFITPANIDALIAGAGFAGEIGILSVDIDGNDYWVLEAISSVKPWIIVAEMNALFGDRHAITVPYVPDFDRIKAHFSGLYFGASIVALTELCARKGYRLIGTGTSGVNAFFVRDDVAGPVLSAIGEVRAWPSRHREGRDETGRLTAVRGLRRVDVIREMPVVDVRTGGTVTLGSLDPLYSDEWLAGM